MRPDPSATIPAASLEQLCIDTLRFLSVDAVQKADSGHPGMPLGAAAMAYVLWTHFLKHHPANPAWFDRDRFVLSAGHGSMLLYSLLHVTGYALPLEQIKQFRQWGSMTPGHPERGLTPGVETTTGPLGQGFGNVVGDGDLMEGIASEATSLAGHLQLGKLIICTTTIRSRFPPAPTSPSSRIARAASRHMAACASGRGRQRSAGHRASALERSQ